ncbi:MAG TPA: hypothetical protein DDZ80_07675 [Cyanobacteria bacterium UBA8803]|nr:hypothetical protein [Cyanobacteria bacterium UBA9273]HBL58388.1 hypothetical protein [Cyanobacteria bacterium UBA8803]
MAFQLRRPILVGGIALSFGLWLWEGVHGSIADLGELGLFGAIALGTGVWFFQRRGLNQLSSSTPPVDRQTVVEVIARTEVAIAQLETEADRPDLIGELRQRLTQLTHELDRQAIQLTVTGGKGVGKTRLVQVLESYWLPQQLQSLTLQETPPLFVGNEAKDMPSASDLILFVISGDLTDTEFQTLQQLRAVHQRILLVFNKQDQYLPPERAIIWQQLRQRLAGELAAEDVVAISAAPAPVKVRQHQPDASVQEWMEEQTPDLAVLTQRLNQILEREAQQLIWTSTMRATVALKAEVKTVLNHVRRDRALPTIEQYQWIAAATAFANPVPALDLLATAAISGQLILDLGGIYQQKFSLSQAGESAKTLSSLMLKLGLVELSTQAIGSILKSNALTYVAGGALQGVSAAYLTRLAGLSLIEYFQEQEVGDNSATEQPLNLERLGQKLQKVFQQNQRAAFLQDFVQQALGRLRLLAAS